MIQEQLGRLSEQLRAIAERIETEAQLDTLVELDCGKGQGYLLAHPMLSGDVELMMKELRSYALAA